MINNATRSEKAQDNMYSLLKHIFDMCSKQHTKISLSNLVRYYGLPTNTLIELKSLNILKSHGSSDYFWSGEEPTQKFADELYSKCAKIMSKYSSDKKEERLGLNPNTIRIGTKSFIKIIKEDNKKEVRDRLSTPTEFKVDNYIKYIRRYLHNRNMLSFSDYCESVNISEQFEYAFIELGIVKKINGLIKVGQDSYKPSDIRKIIEVQRKYKTQDLPKPKMIEEFINEPQINQPDIKIMKTHTKTINSCLQALHAMYNDFLINKKIKSINFYKKTYGISSEVAVAITKLGIVVKSDKDYIWKSASIPDTDMVEKIFKQRYETVKNRFNVIKHNNLSTISHKNDNIINKDEDLIIPKTKKISDTKVVVNSDDTLKRQIAIKLIKLGELSEADNLLNSLL